MYYLRFDNVRVPSKSNSYRYVTRKTKVGLRTIMIKSDAVIAYEALVQKSAISAANGNQWPELLFPAQETVQVTLIWHRGSMHARDLDNIWKSTLDGISASKRIWADDRQVTSQIARMRFDAPSEAEEWLEIIIEADPWAPDDRWIRFHQPKTTSSSRRKKSPTASDSTPTPGSTAAPKDSPTPGATASSPAKRATSSSVRATSSKRSSTGRTASGSAADAPKPIADADPS